MARSLIKWRNFWILWLTGIVIIIALVSQNDRLVTEITPRGMVDHQLAATAQRIELIHAAWRAAGTMDFFKIAILFDLLFIVLYSTGGVIGGLLVRRSTRSVFLRALASLAIIAYAIFGVLDLTETLSQTVQGFVTGGNDLLAALAATVQPPKMLAFFVGFPALVAALIWFRLENSRSA